MQGIFDNFLMAALHGAVTIVKVNNIAVIICKHLYFDMLWSADVFLDEDLVITESLLGFIAASRYSFGISSALLTIRIPRPPPPLEAFSITG